MYQTIQCPCDNNRCSVWHVCDMDARAVQFTKEQAELVAAVLNETETVSEYAGYVDDEQRFGASGPHKRALDEIRHYAAQYADEGEIRIERIIRLEVK